MFQGSNMPKCIWYLKYPPKSKFWLSMFAVYNRVYYIKSCKTHIQKRSYLFSFSHFSQKKCIEFFLSKNFLPFSKFLSFWILKCNWNLKLTKSLWKQILFCETLSKQFYISLKSSFENLFNFSIKPTNPILVSKCLQT